MVSLVLIFILLLTTAIVAAVFHGEVSIKSKRGTKAIVYLMMLHLV